MSQQPNSNTANVSPRTSARLNAESGRKRGKEDTHKTRKRGHKSKKQKQHSNASTDTNRMMNDGNSTVILNRLDRDHEGYQSDSDIDDREQNSSEDVDLKKMLFAFMKQNKKHMKQMTDENKRNRDDTQKIRDDLVKLTQEVKERPPVKNVEEKSNAGNCSSLSDCVISVGLQTSINSGLRMYIRNEVYGELKFIKDDTMANNMIKQAVVKNYIQMPNGWTSKLFRSHMTRRAYQAFGGIRQNNMSQARKKFIGKNW